ncbi:MAG: O-antigen ligase family protein [Acidimicrobiia bacterium]|nr:O-antigen ligase family protein [Acidimicrobiia bacterium]
MTTETEQIGLEHGSHQLSQSAAALAREKSRKGNIELAMYLTLALLAGYLFFDRAFAWLHVPGTPLFIGEIVMVVVLSLTFLSHHVLRLFQLSRPMQALGVFVMWGFILMGIGLPSAQIDAVRDAALFYYAFFAVVAGVILLARPDLEDRMINLYTRALALFFSLGWIRLLFQGGEMEKIENGFPLMPDSLVPITSHKTGNIAVQAAMGLIFVGLLVWPRLKKTSQKTWWALLSLSGLAMFVVAGTQTRGGMLAGGIAFIFLWAMSKATRRTMISATLITLVLATLAVSFDVKFDLDRREVSVQQFAGNIFSILTGGEEGNAEEELAQEDPNANTANWRLELWGDVWGDVVGFRRGIAGFGFGESLAERYDKADTRLGEEIQLRNPHNSHLSVLARMGVTGAVLWVILFVVWFRTLSKARRNLQLSEKDQKARLLLWCQLSVIAILINAFFDPTLEGPQVGIWLWFIFGMGSAIAFEGHRERWRRTMERAKARKQLVSGT